jgi:hypothetical protein
MATVLLLKFSRTPRHKEKEHKIQIIVVDVHGYPYFNEQPQVQSL